MKKKQEVNKLLQYIFFLKKPSHLILDFESKVKNNKTNAWYYNANASDSSGHRSVKTPVALIKSNEDSNSFEKNIYTYLKNSSNNIYYSPILTNANVNFLRKERLYTKLKYSRSPAYDIVSGGMAALLAGFIGFLISEKFGFELVDSGDFYFFFMYVVFLCFSLRPLLITFNTKTTFIEAISVKPVIKFYLGIFYLLLKKIK